MGSQQFLYQHYLHLHDVEFINTIFCFVLAFPIEFTATCTHCEKTLCVADIIQDCFSTFYGELTKIGRICIGKILIC